MNNAPRAKIGKHGHVLMPLLNAELIHSHIKEFLVADFLIFLSQKVFVDVLYRLPLKISKYRYRLDGSELDEGQHIVHESLSQREFSNGKRQIYPRGSTAVFAFELVGGDLQKTLHHPQRNHPQTANFGVLDLNIFRTTLRAFFE
jgi:hypothetical protein